MKLCATIVALLCCTVYAQEASEDDAQLQPVSEEPVKLLHVLNPGEREYLSPNLIGVQNIAMSFLPLTMNFVNIIDAFREIVDGVRYEIVLNAVNTKDKDADIICRLVILEKPWLRTQWGDKVRELRHSNCTSEADNLTDPAARSKALNEKYESNAFFNGGSRNELSNDEMAKLESQIMSFPSTSGMKRRVTSTSTTTTTTSTTEQPETSNEPASVTLVTPATSNDEVNSEDASTTQPPELSDDEKNLLDGILSAGALNFETSRRIANNQRLNSELETEKDIETESKETPNTDDDESNFVRNTRTDQLSELNKKDDTEGGNDDTQQQEELFEPEQFEEIHNRPKRSKENFVGGVTQLDTNEAKTRLQTLLDKLATGEGPNYKISKIHSASTQLVAGTLTKIDADLIDEYDLTERCSIEIWTRLWLKNDGNEITFKCPSKPTVKTRHSRSVEYAEKKTHKKHNHHNLGKTEHLFSKFQTKFNRVYHNTMERQMRLRIFKQNLKTIEELNANEMGSAKYGLTEFADMTSTEYKQRTGLWQREPGTVSNHLAADIPNIELPKEFDWRQKGVITNVKNQGSCGSCWAFSVTGNVEGLHAVKTGKLEEYSEQELLDCDTIDSACNGGLPDNAYKAILKIGGLELESEYPYKGRKEQCHFNKTMSHVKVTGAIDLPKNETAMAQWLIANGPISIGINANAMQFYRGGVSHPWKPLCSHSNLDHGVLIVGYGVSDYPMFKKTLPYWIVKNSWGPKWGEQGYYRVYRGDNTCGVSEMATSAILDITE